MECFSIRVWSVLACIYHHKRMNYLNVSLDSLKMDEELKFACILIVRALNMYIMVLESVKKDVKMENLSIY